MASHTDSSRLARGAPGRGQAPGDEGQPVVAVANRLPVHHGDDGWQLSPGGLVTALRPVMTNRTGAWVGWDGGAKGIPPALPDFNVELRPISLSAAHVRDYYRVRAHIDFQRAVGRGDPAHQDGVSDAA